MAAERGEGGRDDDAPLIPREPQDERNEATRKSRTRRRAQDARPQSFCGAEPDQAWVLAQTPVIPLGFELEAPLQTSLDNKTNVQYAPFHSPAAPRSSSEAGDSPLPLR